jgi:hypothetical protein
MAAKLLIVGHSVSPFWTAYDTTGYAKCIDSGFSPSGLFAGGLNHCAISPDGSLIAFAHSNSPFLRVFSLPSWEEVTITGGLPPNTGFGVAFSPNGAFLAVGHGSSPFLTVYNTSDWSKVSASFGLTQSARRPSFSPDGSLLAVPASIISSGNILQVFSTSTWSAVHSSSVTATTSTGGDARFSPDGTRLAVAFSTTPFLRVFNVSDWSSVSIAGGAPTGAGSGCDFSPDGSRLAVAHTTSPFMTVYNTSDWSKVTISGGNPTGNGLGIRYNPEGTLLAIGHSTTPFLTIYNTSTWAKQTIAGGALPGDGLTPFWTPGDMKRVIAGEVRDDTGTLATRTVRMYHRATGTLLASGASTGGAFSGVFATPSEVQRLVLDDDAGALHNDLLDRVIPGLEP